MTHTPGPWIVSSYAKNLVTTADDKVGVADVAMCGPWCPKPPQYQQDANTWLIAAAPEMLAALEEIISQAFVECNCGTECSGTCTYSKATRSVAKAKGEHT